MRLWERGWDTGVSQGARDQWCLEFDFLTCLDD